MGISTAGPLLWWLSSRSFSSPSVFLLCLLSTFRHFPGDEPITSLCKDDGLSCGGFLRYGIIHLASDLWIDIHSSCSENKISSTASFENTCKVCSSLSYGRAFHGLRHMQHVVTLPNPKSRSAPLQCVQGRDVQRAAVETDRSWLEQLKKHYLRGERLPRCRSGAWTVNGSAGRPSRRSVVCPAAA